MNKLVAGLTAGLVATGPMTLTLGALYRYLPWREWDVPPYAITMEVAEWAGAKEHLNLPQRLEVTVASHFAYGAAMGAGCAPAVRKLPLHPVVGGIACGLGVWAASYAGWLPALNIYPSPAKKSARHTAIIIASHVVWGAVMGLLVERLDSEA